MDAKEIIEILRNNSYDCFILKDDKLTEIAKLIQAKSKEEAEKSGGDHWEEDVCGKCEVCKGMFSESEQAAIMCENQIEIIDCRYHKRSLLTISAKEYLQNKYPSMRGNKWNNHEIIDDDWVSQMMEEYAQSYHQARAEEGADARYQKACVQLRDSRMGIMLTEEEDKALRLAAFGKEGEG